MRRLFLVEVTGKRDSDGLAVDVLLRPDAEMEIHAAGRVLCPFIVAPDLGHPTVHIDEVVVREVKTGERRGVIPTSVVG